MVRLVESTSAGVDAITEDIGKIIYDPVGADRRFIRSYLAMLLEYLLDWAISHVLEGCRSMEYQALGQGNTEARSYRKDI